MSPTPAPLTDTHTKPLSLSYSQLLHMTIKVFEHFRSLDEPPSSLPAFSGREKCYCWSTTVVAEIAIRQWLSNIPLSSVLLLLPFLLLLLLLYTSVTSDSSGVSPAKLVDLRHNYLEQVKE